MPKTSASGKPIDLGAVTEDIIADIDDTYNLGSQSKRWKYLYAVLAVLTAMTIGGIYIGSTPEGYLFINATTQVNGSMLVRDNVTASNFYGYINHSWIQNPFITAMDEDYLYMVGTTGTFNETKQNETIDEKIKSVTYNASAIQTLYGTLDAGNLASVQAIDLDWYNVSEAAGANALRINVTFRNVTNFGNILLRSRYAGGLGHEIEVQLWDYTVGDWDNYGQITDQSVMSETSLFVLDPSFHISNGIVQLRFEHLDTGSPAHKFYLDYVALQDGFTTLTSAQHDSLLGRDDPNNHPWVTPYVDAQDVIFNNSMKDYVDTKIGIWDNVSGVATYYGDAKVDNLTVADTISSSISNSRIEYKDNGDVGVWI